jgi:pilus assembly protein FimV
LPVAVLAAELGRITIASGVGEPLRAEIEIVSVSPAEAKSLGARIPPPDVFWRSGLEPAPALRSIRTAVERRPQGRHVVTLRSTEPMLEPFMDILVELSSDAGRAIREYTFLLEEGAARRQPTIASTTRGAADTVSPPTRAPVAREASDAVPALRTGEGQYKVKPGDTLASIAREHSRGRVTLDQMVVALYQANPDAFLDDNMNRLKTGRVLAIPDEVAALAADPSEARRVVQEHRASFDEHRNKLAAAVANSPAGPASKTSQQTAGPVTPRTDPAAATSNADQLTLSSQARDGKEGAAATAARDDDIVAMQRALSEAQERIAMLEKSLQEMRSLLEIKSQQVAQLPPPSSAPASGAGGAAAAEMPRERGGSLPNMPTEANDSSFGRTIARALAWMSLGAAAALVPIAGFVWLRSRNERRRAMMIRQATGRHRHKKRRAHRSERSYRIGGEREDGFSNEP